MPAALLTVSILLLLCHMLGDYYAAFYGPLVPRLRETMGLSLPAVTMLATIYGAASNFMQPVFGMIGERFGRRKLLGIGLVLSAVGMSGMGVARSLPAMTATLIVGGIGVGMFHPVGAAFAGRLGGEWRSAVLATYMVGGNLGVMLAPLVVPAVAQADMRLIGLMAIPGVGLAWLILQGLPAEGPAPPKRAATHLADVSAAFRRVWPIFIDVTLRFVPLTLYATLLPIYNKDRGMNEIEAGRPLAAFMLAGGAGVVVGGYLSRRISHRALVISSEAAAGVCLLIAPMANGLLYYALLAVGAFFAYLVMSAQIAVAQRLVPQTEGAASGIVMGLAYGLASMALTPLGWLAAYWTQTSGSELTALTRLLQVSTVCFFAAAAAAAAYGVQPAEAERAAGNTKE